MDVNVIEKVRNYVLDTIQRKKKEKQDGKESQTSFICLGPYLKYEITSEGLKEEQQ